MSAVNHEARRLEAEPRVGLLAVSWVISGEAAGPAFRVVSPQAAEVELRWLIDVDRGASTLIVADGSAEHRLAAGTARVEWDGPTGLMHLHAAAGQDELVATLRDESVLYARTTVMERLGIPGGRYEVRRSARAATPGGASAPAC